MEEEMYAEERRIGDLRSLRREWIGGRRKVNWKGPQTFFFSWQFSGEESRKIKNLIILDFLINISEGTVGVLATGPDFQGEDG